MMKNLTILLMLAAIALLFPACEKSLEQSMTDLQSDEAETRKAAIERLGEDGEPLAPQLTSALSTEDEQYRQTLFSVLIRLGEPAMAEMLDKIGYAFKDKKTREGFTDYFRSLGDKGYNALLEKLMSTADAEAAEHKPEGSIVKLGALHHRFEAISLVLESLDNNLDVGRVPELLKHPYGKVRTRAAYLLCIKNWQPSSPELAMIFYSHLASTLECPNVADPVDDAAQMAATDFKLFLETDKQYPPEGNARYRILAATGSDEVADYLYEQTRQSQNEFIQYNYFRVLAGMQTDKATALARKLLRDPKIGKSLRVLDPNIDDNL